MTYSRKCTPPLLTVPERCTVIVNNIHSIHYHCCFIHNVSFTAYSTQEDEACESWPDNFVRDSTRDRRQEPSIQLLEEDGDQQTSAAAMQGGGRSTMVLSCLPVAEGVLRILFVPPFSGFITHHIGSFR